MNFKTSSHPRPFIFDTTSSTSQASGSTSELIINIQWKVGTNLKFDEEAL